jgi:hypothetical protein
MCTLRRTVGSGFPRTAGPEFFFGFLDFGFLDFFLFLFDRKKPNLDASGYAQLWHSIEGTELNPPYRRDIGTRVGIVPQHIE